MGGTDMWTLLKKDIYLLRKTFLLWLPVLLLPLIYVYYLARFEVLEKQAAGIFFLIIFSLLLGLVTFLDQIAQKDDLQGGLKFIRSLPLNLRLIVKARFLFLLIACICCWLLASLLLFLASQLNLISMAHLKPFILLALKFFIVLLGLGSLGLLLYFRSGYFAIRNYLLIGGFCFAALLTLVFFPHAANADWNIVTGKYWLWACIVAIALYLLSLLLSPGALRRREF